MNKIKSVKFKKEGDEWKIIEEKEEDLEIIDIRYEIYIYQVLVDKDEKIHFVKLHGIIEKDLKDQILNNPSQNFKNLKDIKHILYTGIDIIPIYYTNVFEIKNNGERIEITKYGKFFKTYEKELEKLYDKIDINKEKYEEYYPLEYKNEE